MDGGTEAACCLFVVGYGLRFIVAALVVIVFVINLQAACIRAGEGGGEG
jgi:hypothetical protein